MDDSTGIAWTSTRPFAETLDPSGRFANAAPVSPPLVGTHRKPSTAQHNHLQCYRQKPRKHGPQRLSRVVVDEEPMWTSNLVYLVSLFMDKCSKRVLLHREAAHYYARRLRLFSVPGAILGAVGTSVVFATWKGELCGRVWHEWTLLGSGVCMLFSTGLGALVSKSQYPALYAAHVKSYRNFDSLLKKLTVELSFEPTWRQPVRAFIDEMIAEYDRHTGDAELVPREVEAEVQKMLQEARERAREDLEAGNASVIMCEGRPLTFDRVDSNNDADAGSPISDKTDETSTVPTAAARAPTAVPDARRRTAADLWQRGLEGVKRRSSTAAAHANVVEKRVWGNSVRRYPIQYCNAMPFSSLIEMEAPTYEDQISGSNQNASTPTTTATHTDYKSAPEIGYLSARPERPLHQNRRVSHAASVRSAVRHGMNDVTASHQSQSTSTTPEKTTPVKMSPTENAMVPRRSSRRHKDSRCEKGTTSSNKKVVKPDGDLTAVEQS